MTVSALVLGTSPRKRKLETGRISIPHGARISRERKLETARLSVPDGSPIPAVLSLPAIDRGGRNRSRVTRLS